MGPAPLRQTRSGDDETRGGNDETRTMQQLSGTHGIIKGIDTETARNVPGVLGVWTGADLASAGYNPFTCGLPIKNRDGSPLLQTNQPESWQIPRQHRLYQLLRRSRHGSSWPRPSAS